MRKRAGPRPRARAGSGDPVLDEPTAGLDPIGAAAFDRLIGAAAKPRPHRGHGHHDLDLLAAICDRVAALVTSTWWWVRCRSCATWITLAARLLRRPRGRAALAAVAMQGVRLEIRASYVIVGAVVLVLLAGLAASACGSSRPGSTATARYEIAFAGSVSGLPEGGQVLYRGIPVGRVGDIRIDPDNVETVLVAVEVDRETPIKADTVATLEFQGLTGIAYVQLRAARRRAPGSIPTRRRRRASRCAARPWSGCSNPRPSCWRTVAVVAAGLAADRREPGGSGRHLAQCGDVTAALADRSGGGRTFSPARRA